MNLLKPNKLNIADLLNKSRGDIAYTLVDVEGAVPAEVATDIAAIKGVLCVRLITNGK